jgi:dTDP-4-amino-4,6-dideoxygalactose transaminase
MQIEGAIGPRTRAVVPVHYAGVGCEMDAIIAISSKHGLTVIEDAAQGVNATYKGRYLGTIGDMGCYSFHESKNFVAGEGGAFVTNNKSLARRAEIIREKGTNRSQFFRGEIDKYTWMDVGSSYIASDLLAAVLLAQLEAMEEISVAPSRL